MADKAAEEIANLKKQMNENEKKQARRLKDQHNQQVADKEMWKDLKEANAVKIEELEGNLRNADADFMRLRKGHSKITGLL